MKRPVSSPGNRARRREPRIGLAALVVLCLGAAAGCRLNSAAGPIGVQPDVTSVMIDPVTLRPVTSKPVVPARERKPAGLDEAHEEGKPDAGL